jgi:hypothetical protein
LNTVFLDEFTLEENGVFQKGEEDAENARDLSFKDHIYHIINNFIFFFKWFYHPNVQALNVAHSWCILSV